MAGKLLEVLTEAVPHARHVAVVFNPTRPGLRAYAKEGTVAEKALGLTIPAPLLFQATKVIQ